MKQEKYEHVTNSSDLFKYEFTSVGPKGEIAMTVQFDATEDPNIVTLAFGNTTPGGYIDDQARNDNTDRNKILATVAAIVYKFTTIYPDKLILFTGSTPARTRLYRMAITTNLEELSKHFIVFGFYETNSVIKFEEFKKQVAYHSFGVQRKNINLQIWTKR